MVQIQPPPPTRLITPIFLDIPTGAHLVRIFDPTRRKATALMFRANGPRKRFDHHRGRGPNREPCDDLDRAVYYAAWSTHIPEALSSCIVEVFGDTGIVEFGDLAIGMPSVTRPLHLLELRDHGAMCAGTVAAIAKCEHQRSQPWSRYFYEHAADFDAIDGLIYRNAHNDEPAIVLYERAADALSCPFECVIRLDHPGLRSTLVQIMQQSNLTL